MEGETEKCGLGSRGLSLDELAAGVTVATEQPAIDLVKLLQSAVVALC